MAKSKATKPVTHEEVELMRLKVRDILTKATQKAELSGKPLLILVGEMHTSPHSALLESMIYQEARKLRPTDLALELPSKNPRVISGLEKTHIQRFFTQASGMLLTYKQAKHVGAPVHLVDGRHHMIKLAANGDIKDPKLPERNETIAANLANNPESVMMITGQRHLQGLIPKMHAHATHEVVSFDTTDEKFTSFALKGKFSLKPVKGVHKLQLSGDARRLDMDSVITLGLGEDAGTEFIAWAEKNNHKFTPQKASEILAHAPKSTKAVSALYELGRDSEAGKAFARLLSKGIKSASIKKSELCERVKEAKQESMLSYSLDFNTSFAHEIDRAWPCAPEATKPRPEVPQKAVPAPERVSIRHETPMQPTMHVASKTMPKSGVTSPQGVRHSPSGFETLGNMIQSGLEALGESLQSLGMMDSPSKPTQSRTNTPPQR